MLPAVLCPTHLTWCPMGAAGDAQMRDVQFYVNTSLSVAEADSSLQEELRQATLMAVGRPSRVKASLERRANRATAAAAQATCGGTGAGAGGGTSDAAASGEQPVSAASHGEPGKKQEAGAGSKAKRGARKKKGRRKR